MEVVFTLRWALHQYDRDSRVDPGFDLGLGQFYNLVRDELPRYLKRPVHPFLPTSALNYKILARFEPEGGSFPLYQLGPGIFTANAEGGSYEWTEYQAFVKAGVAKLVSSYSVAGDDFAPGFTDLSILYVNRLIISDFDSSLRFSDFLTKHFSYPAKPKMVPEGLRLKSQELSFDFILPDGLGELTITIVDDSDFEAEQSVFWEVQASNNVNGTTLEEIGNWLTEVHVFTHKIFRTMVSEELLAYFDRKN